MNQPVRVWRLLIVMLSLLLSAAIQAQSSWYNFAIQEDELSGLVDFSALNKPLEASDRVFVKNAHFYTLGPDLQRDTSDDKRVRFFGINLAASANFPQPEYARLMAQRLRRLGFNAVRLHQLDNYPGESVSQPRSVLSSGAFPSFNDEAIRRLRALISALRDEGIYVNLNLHVGYQFRPATDQVSNLAPAEEMPYGSHPYHLFDSRMLALQVDYARQLVRRLALREEAALAMVEINNESSLVGAWHRRQLDKLSADYERNLQALWLKWITRRYGSLEQACQHWQSCDLPRQGGLLVKAGEALYVERGSGLSAKLYNWGRRLWQKLDWQLPKALQLRFDTPEQGLARRVYDYTAFLVELDQNYLQQISKALRGELGEMVPITGTQMYFGGIANSISHQNLDYLDEHFYVDHYQFPNKEWDAHDWRIRNHSVTKHGFMSLLKRGWYRDIAKPFVMSEYNQAFPNQHAAEIMPALSIIASAQDWDGLFFYHYIDGDNWLSAPSAFSLSGHVGQLAGAGIAASLFRQFVLPANNQTQTLILRKEQRLMLASLGDEVRGFGLADFARMQAAAPDSSLFLQRIGHAAETLTKKQELPVSVDSSSQAAAAWRRADQRMYYQPTPGALRASTDTIQIYLGATVPAREARQQLFWPYFYKSASERASVLLASRDGESLSQSRQMLLVLVGATTGSQGNKQPAQAKTLQAYPGEFGWWTFQPDPGQSAKPSGSWSAFAPLWQERIAVELLIPSQYKKLKVYALDGKGKRISAQALREIKRNAQGFLIDLDYPSPWFELVTE